jgi:hypothetical protein
MSHNISNRSRFVAVAVKRFSRHAQAFRHASSVPHSRSSERATITPLKAQLTGLRYYRVPRMLSRLANFGNLPHGSATGRRHFIGEDSMPGAFISALTMNTIASDDEKVLKVPGFRKES